MQRRRRAGPGAATPGRSAPRSRQAFVDLVAHPRLLRRCAGARAGSASRVRRRARDDQAVTGPGPGVWNWLREAACERAGKVVHFGIVARSARSERLLAAEAGAARRPRPRLLPAATSRSGFRSRTTRRSTCSSSASPSSCVRSGTTCARKIVVLLRERAHSTTELAEKLGLPKGTVGHHVKVLEKAGLIRVVRTRKVRALTERSTAAPRASSSSRAPTMQTARASGTSRRLPSVPRPRRCFPRSTTTGRPSPFCECASPTPTRAGSCAGSRSSSATSSPPTTRTASRTASPSRSSGRAPDA